MIPYIPHPSFSIGPFTLHAFAVLVLVGVTLGAILAYFRGREQGIPGEQMEAMFRWALIPGFILAHVLEIVLYQQDRLANEGLPLLFRFWDGLSSYGGFIGAAIGLLIFRKLNKNPRSWYDWGDLAIQGLVLGWVFGRLGCTLAHDHPGSFTDFPLAFAYPDGARHNLGFYEFIYTTLFLFPLTLFLHRCFKPVQGVYIALITLAYAPIRFSLDFLRAPRSLGGDIRYFGLTPAQYISLLAICFAFYLLFRAKKNFGRVL